jgi:hypothetical protein
MGRRIIRFLIFMYIRVCHPEDVIGFMGGRPRYRQYPVVVDLEEFMTQGCLVDEVPVLPGPLFVEDSVSVFSSPSYPGIFT